MVFEQIWTHHPDCVEVIKYGWNTKGGQLSLHTINERIKQTTKQLERWSCKEFPCVKNEIKRLQKEFDELQRKIPN